MTREEYNTYEKTTKYGKLNSEEKARVIEAYQLLNRVTGGMWYAEIEALLEMFEETIKISSKFCPEYVPGFDD